MENTAFFEYGSMVILFPIILLQVVILIAELFIFFLYKLFSPDKIITYGKPAPPTKKEIRSVKMVTYFVTFISIFSAYSLYEYQSFLFVVPYVVSGVILYANWKLARRIYTLYKYGTEKKSAPELD